VVELADDQLSIEPIHRLVHLAPADAGPRQLLSGSFTITAAGANTPDGVERLERSMKQEGGMGLVDGDGLALLVATSGPSTGADDDPAARTDAARFETVVVPLLGGASIEYRHDALAVAALVAKGVADAAFLLRPVSVADTRAAALAGIRMPQKTTFFAPKPRTGMVFRTLD
jgi:hypothetical protein